MNDLIKSNNTRAIAAGILQQWLETGDFPDRIMRDLHKDRAFIMEMVYGVLRHLAGIEWLIQRLSRHNKEAENPLLPVLGVGLYQTLYMDHVVPYAAVNETVDAAHLMHGDREAAFVNAVLRRALREKAPLLHALKSQPLSIRQSHPDWLVERWIAHFGGTETERLCAWNNERSETVLRIRPMLSPAAFLATLQKLGFEASAHPAAPEFVVAPRGVSIQTLPGYQEGWFIAQDPATRNAVRLLDPQPGENVLDACAAPGGKSIALADHMRDHAHLYALDPQSDRIQVMRENVDRCGLQALRIVQGDARSIGLDAFDGTPFDAVLLDVPCSNSGVLQRRPDARYRLSPAFIQEVATLQRAILDNTAHLLRSGGRLVYSTCSLEEEENEEQVRNFIKKHPKFRLISQTRTFPPRDRVDGAYAALLQAN